MANQYLYYIKGMEYKINDVIIRFGMITVSERIQGVIVIDVVAVYLVYYSLSIFLAVHPMLTEFLNLFGSVFILKGALLKLRFSDSSSQKPCVLQVLALMIWRNSMQQ